MTDLDRLTLDKPYAQHPDTRAAAARYVLRTCPDDAAEMLMALGLAHDPVGAERNQAKAYAAMHKIPAPPGKPKLTARQREILTLITKGLTYRQIGERIGISHHSVGEHVQKIKARYDLPDRGAVLALLNEPDGAE